LHQKILKKNAHIILLLQKVLNQKILKKKCAQYSSASEGIASENPQKKMRTIFFCFRRYCIRKSSKKCAQYSSASEGTGIASENPQKNAQNILLFQKVRRFSSENPQKNAQNILLFQKVRRYCIRKSSKECAKYSSVSEGIASEYPQKNAQNILLRYCIRKSFKKHAHNTAIPRRGYLSLQNRIFPPRSSDLQNSSRSVIYQRNHGNV
jgi:hypothetical protein